MAAGSGRAFFVTALLAFLGVTSGCQLWSGFPTAAASAEPPNTVVEMTVREVALDRRSQSNVLILKEKDEERFLALAIGEGEAAAISIQLEKRVTRRPLTHDLLRTTIAGLGGQVAWVVLTDFRDDTYYATIVMRRDDQQVDLDARPSDAVALALRTQAKIYADRALLDKQGIRVPGRDNRPPDSSPPRRSARVIE